MEFPFINNDYPAPENLFLDMQQPDGRPALLSTHGLELFCDFSSSSEIRGMHYVNALDALMVVCGSSVFKVTGRQAYELIDTLSTSTGFVWMEDNGIELLISDGTYGYVYNFTVTYDTIQDIGKPTYFLSLIDTSGSVWTWGLNDKGQLGDNSATDRSSPVAVVGSHSFDKITGGGQHQVGLKASGAAWAWGYNSEGQLGDNTATDRSSPVAVVGSHSFTKVCGCLLSSVGLKASGSAWTWGRNDEGQLGDNTTTDRSSPVSVVGAHTFTDIAGGRHHKIGLKADGTAWAWGKGDDGRLGDNTATTKSSPVSVVGAHSFVDIGCGGEHSFGLKADGTVWAWGKNNVAQLGDNSTTARSSPVAVVGSHSFEKIAASGGDHTVALKADGAAWAWGYNLYGGLGDGTTSAKSSPVAVVGSHSFTDMSSNYRSTIGLKADGSVWTWGDNSNGQLGDNSTTNRSSPVVILRKFQPLASIGPSNMGTITFIDGFMACNDVGTQRWYLSASYEAGNWPDLDYTSAEELPDDLVAVIMSQGELWALGETSVEVYQNTGALDFPFARVPGAFLDIGCGSAASVARKDSSIFWLDNNNRVRRSGGPLGYSSTVISTPAMDEEIDGYGTTSDAEGFTYSYGGHDFYVITFPSIPKTWVYDITSTAHAETHIWHKRISGTYNRWLGRCHAELGGYHVIGDYREGKLYFISDAALSDFGLSLTRRYLGPVVRKDRKRIYFHAFEVEIEAALGTFYGIAATGNATHLLLGDGSAYSTGLGTNGALGDGTATTKSSPVAVVGSHSFAKIGAGSTHGVGLKHNGEAWSWGNNTGGGLGDETATSRSSPVAVVGSHSFIDVSGGVQWSAGLKSIGSAWTWGLNTSGQLGDNSTTNRSSPVSVVGDHSFVSISAGFDAGVGLKRDGSAWCWGYNAHGALGDNTTDTRSSPVAVVGSHSFVSVSSGNNLSSARKSDGSVWTWGRNSNGQLGDNSTTARSSPVSVVGSHSFEQVSAGSTHMLGLKSNGEVWAWGAGTNGRLGDNTTTGKSSPVSVVGAHSFIEVLAGTAHSVGLKANGQVWAWGNNDSGQLGDNTATSRSSPVQVVMSFGAQAVIDWKDEHSQWSSTHNVDIPTSDNSYIRSRLRRLGEGRSRQFRVTVEDAVDVTVKAAYIDIGEEDKE